MTMMIYHKYIKQFLIAGGFFFFTACEAPPAYIYADQEFDRESNFFLKGITSRKTVIICYHKDGTTPKKVADLAKNECKKFSKRAVFTKQNLQVCPFVTPNSAYYRCTE